VEFLDHLRRFHYDIILADYGLPGWTDGCFIHDSQIRQRGSFHSAHGALGEEVAVECISRRHDYVLKDTSHAFIVVSRALQEKTLRDPAPHGRGLSAKRGQFSLSLCSQPSPHVGIEKESLQFLQSTMQPSTTMGMNGSSVLG